MVQLTDHLVALLDIEADRRGLSRSALIREAVVGYLAEAQEAQLSAAIVDGYTRFPPGRPDEWGDLERAADAATEELLQRLDAEEEAQGLSW